ncbi:MAG: hemolysin family protein [Christensenellales bacterium]
MALVLILLICVLIMFSAFFSASEITYAKANRFRIDKAAEEGSKVAKLEQYICDHYVRTLSAVLVGNNLVNIAASSAGTMLFVRVLQLKNGAAIATAVIIALLLLFGETLPRSWPPAWPIPWLACLPIRLGGHEGLFAHCVCGGKSWLASCRPCGRPRKQCADVTTEELVELLDNIEDEGVFTEKEGELIKSAIEITDTMAMEVLTPRVDLLAIDLDDGVPELTDELMQYTRIPVYQDTIDNIVGIMSTKKLIKAIAAGEHVTLQDVMVPPLFVHKTRMLFFIIREFRDKHMQAAIVVDEYGGTLGMVTMEDIMEEIVGEIYDERDAVEN